MKQSFTIVRFGEGQKSPSCLLLDSYLPLTRPLHLLRKVLILCTLLFALGGLNAWGINKTLTLNNLGSSLASSANTSASTTNITATGDDKNSYTINYYQCKKQTNGSNSAMFMAKNQSPYISNHSAMPGDIVSVKVYTLTGAATASYDCAFSTTEITSATAGIGAQSIAANNNHTYTSNISGARYFCITLSGNANGQVWKVDVTYSTAAPTKCATPSFSVTEGTYTESKSVTISCSTSGATIRYTTDGSSPTSTSTVYSSAISVEQTTTIKAKAFKDGLTASDEASATYTIKCATPTFSVNAGTYNESKSVTLSTTYGTKIYYTTNGSNPTTSSTEYTGAITVSKTTTIKAIAWKSGCSNSEIASRTYTIQCATPTFSVNAGTYNESKSVTLSTTYGDKIYYTTNNTTPSTSSTLYEGAIAVNQTTTIKAIAWKEGCSNSSEASATYTLKCVAPTFNVAAGTYTGAQTVTISSTTPGVTIRYTTNGSNPSTTSGTVYSEPITVSSSQTVKAIAYKENWSASTVASAAYTIKYTVNWVVNGTTISTAEVAYNTTAALPTNPDPASYCGHKFMGWTTVKDHDAATAPSPLITSAPTITGDVTYYAVFGYYEGEE